LNEPEKTPRSKTRAGCAHSPSARPPCACGLLLCLMCDGASSIAVQPRERERDVNPETERRQVGRHLLVGRRRADAALGARRPRWQVRRRPILIAAALRHALRGRRCRRSSRTRSMPGGTIGRRARRGGTDSRRCSRRGYCRVRVCPPQLLARSMLRPPRSPLLPPRCTKRTIWTESRSR